MGLAKIAVISGRFLNFMVEVEVVVMGGFRYHPQTMAESYCLTALSGD
jgi:hypothetical protein|tara:strand:+ start:43 stop:186 length:144 start_codon:yes stop_codon:yes gene_type:complete